MKQISTEIFPLQHSDGQMFLQMANKTECYNSDFYHTMFFGLLDAVVHLCYYESLSR